MSHVNPLGTNSDNYLSFPPVSDTPEKEAFLSLFRTAVAGAAIGGAGGVAVALIAAGTVTVLPVLIGGAIGLTLLVALALLQSDAAEAPSLPPATVQNQNAKFAAAEGEMKKIRDLIRNNQNQFIN